jgi:hypothetical protein
MDPEPPNHEEGHDGGHHHRAGHGNAVGVGQSTRTPEGNDQNQHGRQEQEIHLGHIDLALLGLGGPADLHPRQQAQLNGLLREGECPCDHRLARDDGGDGRHADHRKQRPFRVEKEERVLDLAGIIEQQRSLAKIIQGQAGQDEAEPGELDRASPEVPHIGV